MKELLTKEHNKWFKESPEAFYFSPGRINVIGEHIDYNGGRVLPLAISLGIYGSLSFTNDKECRVVSNIFDGIFEFLVTDYSHSQSDSFVKYIKAILYIFNKNGFVCDKGFNLYLYSTLPASSGLSSSAALELLISHIVNDVCGFGLDDLTLVLYSQAAEREYVGVNCGIMDQFAIGMSKKDKAILLDTASIDYQYINFKLDKVVFLILNTNKPRNLSDSKYNERRSECEKALELLNEFSGKKNQNLCEYTLEQLESYKSRLDDVLYRRSYHVITENLRVKKAVIAMENNDYVELGKLLFQSHKSLKDDYEVTGKHLDTIYSSLLKCQGVYGGRMCGAGFGGCAIALVDENKVDEIEKIVSKEYKEKTNIDLSIYIAQSSNRTEKINS